MVRRILAVVGVLRLRWAIRFAYGPAALRMTLDFLVLSFLFLSFLLFQFPPGSVISYRSSSIIRRFVVFVFRLFRRTAVRSFILASLISRSLKVLGSGL